LLALGFVPLDDLSGERAPRIEAQDASCFAVVADPAIEGAEIEVTRGPTTARATGDALFCTCGGETVLASSTAELRVLRAATSDVGGILALEHAVVGKRTLSSGSEACDVDQLTAWGTGARSAKGQPSTALPNADALAERGFRPALALGPPYPFVFVAPTPDTCVVALAEEGDTLSLVSTAKDL